MVGDDRPAEGGQLGDQRIHDPPRAAPRHRPAEAVGEQAHRHAEGGGGGAFQGHHGVGGKAGEERLGLITTEGVPHEKGRWEQGREPEAGQCDRVPWEMDERAKQLGGQGFGGPHRSVEQAPPGSPIALTAGVEERTGLGHRPLEEHDAAIVERMGDGRIRMDPFETVALETERPEEGRGDGGRVDRRAGVVDETGQRQFRRAAAATPASRRSRRRRRNARPGPG